MAKFVSETVGDSDTQQSRDCSCLGHLGQHDTDRIISIGHGKKIRHDIVSAIARNIALNFANVNGP